MEDDPVLNPNLTEIINRSGFAVDSVTNINDASVKISDNDYDVIILDWLLPDGEGVDLCRDFRKQGVKTPVLFLTAKTQVEDRITGLDSGADDYLTKPFDIQELLARLRALTRRQPAAVSPIITIGDLRIDTNTHRLKIQDQLVDLSPKEYAVLEYLALHVDQAVDRIEILNHVWDENANLFSNTVDVHIRYLRQKINQHTTKEYIKTIKGKGYLITDNDT